MFDAVEPAPEFSEDVSLIDVLSICFSDIDRDSLEVITVQYITDLENPVRIPLLIWGIVSSVTARISSLEQTASIIMPAEDDILKGKQSAIYELLNLLSS